MEIKNRSVHIYKVWLRKSACTFVPEVQSATQYMRGRTAKTGACRRGGWSWETGGSWEMGGGGGGGRGGVSKNSLGRK